MISDRSQLGGFSEALLSLLLALLAGSCECSKRGLILITSSRFKACVVSGNSLWQVSSNSPRGERAGKVQLLLRSAATKHYSFSSRRRHHMFSTAVHPDGFLGTVPLLQHIAVCGMCVFCTMKMKCSNV